MKIENNFACKTIDNSLKLQKYNEAPQFENQSTGNEFVGSEASLALKAYASPQIYFGCKLDKIASELNGSKPTNKIHLTVEEVSSYLKSLGFILREGKGSHRVFEKSNIMRPITIPCHGEKQECPSYVLKEIKELCYNRC